LNNIFITNTTTTTQIYSISMVLPTVSTGPHRISGNVRTDVIDGDDVPGATVAAGSYSPRYSTGGA
jgi:hypothetical protein